MSTIPTVDEEALPAGTELGDYVLDAAIGRGGFAITYRAHHIRLTAQTVAVKEYFPQMLARRSHGVAVRSIGNGFGEGCREFLDEGQRLAGIKHPGVVRVINFFEANGTAYLVMDFETGRTLEALIAASQRFEESRVRGLALKLLAALQALHELNILHRDINPSNIIVRDNGDPVLIDFGSARSEVAKLTRAVTSVVTDGYSPVEQYGTLAKSQGAWTDLYSLGATLYHVITGIRPIASPDRQQALGEHEPDPLVPASSAAQGRYSVELLHWIDSLLNVQRIARPANAGQAMRVLLESVRPATPSIPGTRKVREDQRFAAPSSGGSAKKGDAKTASESVPAVASQLRKTGRSERPMTATRNAPEGSNRFAEQPVVDAATPAAHGSASKIESAADSRPDTASVSAAAAAAAVSRAPSSRQKTPATNSRLRWPAAIAALFTVIAIGAWQWQRNHEPAPPADSTSPKQPNSGPQSTQPAPAISTSRQPGNVFRDALRSGGEGPEMVVIPGGSFLMGSPESEPNRDGNEGPQRTVTIQSFAMGTTELTFDDYDRCTAAGVCEKTEDEGWGRGTRPVINVSWEDAQKYAIWLSEQTRKRYRLPTCWCLAQV